jgi:riboflavin biosynthesis pyrimidine reductase
LAPSILGGKDAPTICDGPGLLMAERRKLTLLDAEIVEGEIFCRYGVVR